MSKDVANKNYYRPSEQDKEGEPHIDTERLPIRWMAPECLMDSLFDTEGDVWSFGIVLWEIFSYGEQPYTSFTDHQVLEKVIMGYRLPKPADAPDLVYYLMTMCWGPSRPSFAFLYEATRHWADGGPIDVVPNIKAARRASTLLGNANKHGNYSVLAPLKEPSMMHPAQWDETGRMVRPPMTDEQTQTPTTAFKSANIARG